VIAQAEHRANLPFHRSHARGVFHLEATDTTSHIRTARRNSLPRSDDSYQGCMDVDTVFESAQPILSAALRDSDRRTWRRVASALSFMQLPEARLQLESAARELSALRVARLSMRSAALGRWTVGCIGTDDNPSPPFAAALRRIALNITIEPSPH